MEPLKHSLHSEIASAQLKTEGYILLTFHQQNITLGKKEVEAGWELANQLDPERKRKVCLLTAEWSLLDTDARSFVLEQIKKRPKVAIVIHQLGQKIMGNFVLKFTGNAKHVRLFDNETEAIDWLTDQNH